MFKNLIFITLAFLAVISCTKPAKNEFTITGTVDTTFDGYVLLQKRSQGPLVTIDSMLLASGKFKFKGTVEYPEVYYLTIPGTKSSVPFFIEPAAIQVTVNIKDLDNSRIVGSKSQDEYEAYLDLMDQYNTRIRESYEIYMKAQEEGDGARAREMDSLINLYDQERGDFSKNYVLQNPGSFVSPYIVYRNSWNYEMDDLEKALQNFDTVLNHSVYTGFLQDYLKILKRTDIGMPVIDFEMKDTAGASLTVSGLVGQNYLLLDFWASWCSPCRQENPNLVAMYQKYHDQGFDIFGVSLDSMKDRWIYAIAEDGLSWNHVSDLRGWENEAAKLYGVRSIPANFLIDTNGIIIAKNLRGEDLRKKLEELFPESKPASGR